MVCWAHAWKGLTEVSSMVGGGRYFVLIPTYESDAGITIAGMFYNIDL